uniref:transposase n=1 Tax=Hungatella hathewayi TaxID=154046 RepID=UPI0035661D02
MGGSFGTSCTFWTGAIHQRDYQWICNATEYLVRCTHKIAISNNHILSISETETVFSARGKNLGGPKRQSTVRNQKFICRFLLHILPNCSKLSGRTYAIR